MSISHEEFQSLSDNIVASVLARLQKEAPGVPVQVELSAGELKVSVQVGGAEAQRMRPSIGARGAQMDDGLWRISVNGETHGYVFAETVKPEGGNYQGTPVISIDHWYTLHLTRGTTYKFEYVESGTHADARNNCPNGSKYVHAHCSLEANYKANR